MIFLFQSERKGVRPIDIKFSKSTVKKQPVEDILNFTYMCVYVFIYLFVCFPPPGYTNNDTDLKFGTYTPIDLI